MKFEPEGTEKAPQTPNNAKSVTLEKHEADLLLELIGAETRAMHEMAEVYLALQKATDRAQEARKTRETCCVEFETRYNLKGKRWRFNEKTATLEVISAIPVSIQS